jgi:hypothetical protein
MADAVPDYFQTTDSALAKWRQGDVIIRAAFSMVHLAMAAQPLTPAADEASKEFPDSDANELLSVVSEVPGFIVLTQTCDLVRDCKQRPYVEVAALQEVSADIFGQVMRCERPAFAYVPALSDRRLVAHLERTMTIEKAVLAGVAPVRGLTTDSETAAFQEALARQRTRFAFPTCFNKAMGPFQKRMKARAGKNTPEGRHVDALIEIRVSATPSWAAERVAIVLWLIKSHDPESHQWTQWIENWQNLIDQTGRYTLEGPLRLVRLEDMRASEYLASHMLDLDHLSVR